MVNALEELSPEQAPSKGHAKAHDQAASCLAAAASAAAAPALRAAIQARASSNAAASPDRRSTGADDSAGGEAASSWPRVKELTEAAVLQMEQMLSPASLNDRVAQLCEARLAPAVTELRFLTALTGQHKLQASLDRLFAGTWHQQGSPASAHGACSGCQLSQLLSPRVTQGVFAASLDKSLGSTLDRGQTGQQLAQVAADAALQPVPEPWRSLDRGCLHLLAASQLHREGGTVLATTHRLKHRIAPFKGLSSSSLNMRPCL